MDPQAYAILEEIRRYLRKEMNDLADHMAVGGAKDWSEYQHCVGKVLAFAETEREVISLIEKSERASSE